MIYIAKVVPSGTKESKKHNQSFVKQVCYSYLRCATVTNLLTKCGLKTQYYKLMPGSPFGDLVTVASFQPHLRRAVLCLPPSFSQNLRHMNKQPQSTSDMLRQLQAIVLQNQQRSIELHKQLSEPDNSSPLLVQFDKPFTFKSVWYAN